MSDVLMAPEGESFPDRERLNRHFKKRLARASTPEEEAAIRVEWKAAYERFYSEWADELDAPRQQMLAEAEAIAAARRQYGDPAGAVGNMGRIYANPPRPIEAHWPTVEIIPTEESK